MVQLTDFEIGVEADIEENDEVSDNSDLDSLSSFIDNEEKKNDVSFYRSFNNVEADIHEKLKTEYEIGLQDIENFDEISNLCESSEEEPEIDDFDNLAEKVKKFSESLLPKSNLNDRIEHNSSIRAILYAIRYEKENKTDICNKNEFKNVIDKKLIDQLNMNLYQIYKYSIINVMK